MIHPDRRRHISALEFSPDGSKIIGSTYPDNNIQIWDAKSGAQLQLVNVPMGSGGTRKFWIPSHDYSKLYTANRPPCEKKRTQKDGKAAYSFAFPGSCIQVWDTETGKLIDHLTSDPPHRVRELSGAREAKFLLSLEDRPGTFAGTPEHLQRLWNLETGESQILHSSLGRFLSFNNNGKLMAFSTSDDSLLDTPFYSLGISIVDSYTLKQVVKIEFSEGIHSVDENVRFVDGTPYALFTYRTYKHRNEWDNWNSTIACIDIITGKTIGTFEYPFESDSPIVLSHEMGDETLIFSTWRASPAKLFGVSLPDLKPKWEVELNDYQIAMESVVFDNGEKIAVVCQADCDTSAVVIDGTVEWNLVPQNDLKIISKNGVVLETVTLPVGAETIAKSRDGRFFAVGSTGAVYQLDLSGPFESESR